MGEVCRLEYASAGGNRHPAAADWDRSGTGILAYGAGDNIALWRPDAANSQGVFRTLTGHEDVVNAVKFLPPHTADEPPILVSASADKSIRFWSIANIKESASPLILGRYDHEASINCVAVLPNSNIVAAGSADGTIRFWQCPSRSYENGSANQEQMLNEIKLEPRYIPLTLALSRLPKNPDAIVLAVAGTKVPIEIFISKGQGLPFELRASLTGHEGWIRSLSFTSEDQNDGSDLLLASASQDRYIRLWRIHQGSELPSLNKAAEDPALGILNRSLSNKAHRFDVKGQTYTLTFEALLLGHEDWIYTACWQRWEDSLQLLTSSADNSLAIWEVEAGSGIWVCKTRLGEISGQKGASTATGSTGGLWIGLWSPDAKSVACLGRTGGWRVWRREDGSDRWIQLPAVTGHVKEVKSVAWSPNGDYLLSTSSDQTTRLHAEWRRNNVVTWHEFARPQIHGYDLSCLEMIGDTQFISGADEKLLRVFDEPFATANLLEGLSGVKQDGKELLPGAANVPVLGLSNKTIEADTDGEVNVDDTAQGLETMSLVNGAEAVRPPTEDTLCRHTLWPEHEKLYGHGYEISCCGTTHISKPALIATACKASSLDHAVIRVYSNDGWIELKPTLKAHTLTVTSLEFSSDDLYLLSVGRDRQWCIWRREDLVKGGDIRFVLHAQNPKGHSRMILDCSWVPTVRSTNAITYAFATAGRDKSVKIWRFGENTEVECVTTIQAKTPVTACAFETGTRSDAHLLAYGQEDGFISVVILETGSLKERSIIHIPQDLMPSKTVNQLVWRPRQTTRAVTNGSAESNSALQLAAASDDGTVRVYSIKIDTSF